MGMPKALGVFRPTLVAENSSGISFLLSESTIEQGCEALHHYMELCKLDMMTTELHDARATRPPLAEHDLLDGADARRLEALFRVLASAPRLRLVHALVRAGELSLGELARSVAMTPQAASNQLIRLLDLGVVASERRGAHVFYRLVDPCVASLLYQGLCLAEESARWRP